MIGENLQAITEKYPRIFKDINSDVLVVSEIPEGWINLVDNLCADLNNLMEEMDPENTTNLVVLQVKEKFGSLRFYYHIDTENNSLYQRLKEAIHRAEVNSQTVCQFTGQHGELCMHNRWLMVLCEDKRIELGATKARKELNSL